MTEKHESLTAALAAFQAEIPTMTEAGGFVLRYELRHESGDAIEGVYPLPAPTMQAQQVGTAITYARRYAFCAVTGIAPGGDDTDAAPPAATAPSEDWHAAIWGATDIAALQAVANRLAAAREGTEQLRVAYATKRGQLERAVNDDESGSDTTGGAGAALPADDSGGSGTADQGSE